MSMYGWFGEPWPRADWRAPICEDDRRRVETPVGQNCLLCQEPIADDARGVMRQHVGDDLRVRAVPIHIECDLRSVMGNHLHVSGRCRHIGDCNEQSTLTYRQEALEVWRLIHEQGSSTR